MQGRVFLHTVKVVDLEAFLVEQEVENVVCCVASQSCLCGEIASEPTVASATAEASFNLLSASYLQVYARVGAGADAEGDGALTAPVRRCQVQDTVADPILYRVERFCHFACSTAF